MLTFLFPHFYCLLCAWLFRNATGYLKILRTNLVSLACYNRDMVDSVFTKIINGDIPSHKVYEDELVLAFMDINPVQPGMILVIPKKQIDHFTDLPDEDYQAVMAAVKKIG